MRSAPTGAEQQHRGALAGADGFASAARGATRLSPPRADAGGAGDAVRIEDHDHRAVAQDGVAAEHRDVAQDRRHRLDHDLLGVEHPVDDDAEHVWRRPAPPRSWRRRSGSAVAAERQQVGQADQRQQAVAQPQHRRVVDPLDDAVRWRRAGVLLPARCARTSSTTLICGMAKRSPPASTISAETIASVSGILMVKVVPWPGDALQVDGAADLLDIGLHHVHADAAAGHRGDHGGGGEAGAEDEALDLRRRSWRRVRPRWPGPAPAPWRGCGPPAGRGRRRRPR